MSEELLSQDFEGRALRSPDAAVEEEVGEDEEAEEEEKEDEEAEEEESTTTQLDSKSLGTTSHHI